MAPEGNVYSAPVLRRHGGPFWMIQYPADTQHHEIFASRQHARRKMGQGVLRCRFNDQIATGDELVEGHDVRLVAQRGDKLTGFIDIATIDRA